MAALKRGERLRRVPLVYYKQDNGNAGEPTGISPLPVNFAFGAESTRKQGACYSQKRSRESLLSAEGALAG
jgi:hypothetical protein